jgi:hypothetical protein
MKIYCPESKTLLEIIPPTDPLDANAVVDYYKNGVLTERTYGILNITYDADKPQPYEIAAGLMLHANSETVRSAESFIRESNMAYRITNLDTLEVWIIALGDFPLRTLLYQM